MNLLVIRIQFIFVKSNNYLRSALPHKKGNRKELQKKSLPHNIGNPKKGLNIMISKDSKKEYFKEIQDRYWSTARAGKTAILNEFCKVCNYNRKYAVRLLNTFPKKKQFVVKAKAGRRPQYNDSDMLEFLLKLWKATNLACSKRLKTMIPNWLPHYEQYFNLELSSETKKLLLKISHSTIDRYLKPYRKRYKKAGLSTNKPGSLLKKHIPIKTNQWDETVPGFLEADTVAHCGSSLSGQFVYTVNTVDIATGWTEQRAVFGKGEYGVFNAIEDIENTLPFKLRGFDSDNGNEFLNWHLFKYLTNRKRPVQYTRSREYKKNDNAHIEGKNWTHVRQYFGYQRLDNKEIDPLMNELYKSEWRLLLNLFLTSSKLIDKKRIGSKNIKKHDLPRTPYQRVLDSTEVSDKDKIILRELYKKLNPFLLEEIIKKKSNIFCNLISIENINVYYPIKSRLETKVI